MVSGLVTSPCDHWRIFSGDASEIRIASKSGASCVFSCWNRNTLVLHFFPIGPIGLIGPIQTLNSAGNQRFRDRLFGAAVLLYQLNVKTKRLQLAHEYIKGFRQTWIEVDRK